MKIIIVLFLFITTSICAQSRVEDIVLADLKNQIFEGGKVDLKHEAFNYEQNTLLNKKYKDKIKAELSLLRTDLIVLEGQLFDSVNAVFQKIIITNPSLSSNARLVLYRSNDFNAFTMGDDIIFVHIGLLNEVQNEAQLALVLAHELAHNSLGHVEEALIKAVFIETDKELKDNIKTISKVDYGHVSELNKLLVPRLLENKQESRTNEFQADSLGLIYVKNAGYTINEVLSVFHIMEKHSKSYSEPLSFEKIWLFDKFPDLRIKSNSYSRESSLGLIKKDTSLASYLASHPYDQSRFLKLAKSEHIDTIFDHYKFQTFDLFLLNLKRFIGKESIKTSFLKRNLSEAIFNSMRLLEINPNDTFALESFVLSVYCLGFLKEKRLSGKYLRLQNPEQREDFDRVCSFLYTITPKECINIAKAYRSQSIKLASNGEEKKIFELLDYTINEEYDALVTFWKTNHEEMKNSDYVCLVRDIEMYLRNTKSIRLIEN